MGLTLASRFLTKYLTKEIVKKDIAEDVDGADELYTEEKQLQSKSYHHQLTESARRTDLSVL